MLRSLAKDAVATIASWSGVDAVLRQRLRRDMPYVVGYHRVVERLDAHGEAALPAMEISVATLEKHLDWLARNFEIAPVDDMPARVNRSKPVAAVTFDDGYADVFENAFPMLKRKGIPAAFFVVTDLIGTSDRPVHDRLYAALAKAGIANAFAVTRDVLRRRASDDVLRIVDAVADAGSVAALRPLTWDMLAAMRDAGMTIGSHTKTHAFLTNETTSRIRQELVDSRLVLQQRLGIRADCFAYPGGAFDARVVDAVHQAGYRIGFADCRHHDPRYPMLTIPRRGLWERSCADRFGRFSPAMMSCHSAAIFDRFACSSNH